MHTEDEPDRYRPNVRSGAKFRDRDEGDYSDGPSEARISTQLTYMHESFSKLDALVRGLTDRLEPILIPEEPANVNMIATASPPRQPSSEISNSIDDLNGQISRLQGLIARTTERVQL